MPRKPPPQSPPRTPRAPPKDHAVVSPHGTRNDPYFWLRDDNRENPEVLKFLKAHTRHARDWFAAHGSLERKLYREIIARLKQDDSSVPYLKNGYWYYSRYETGKEHPIYARRAGSTEAPEEIMLDANLLAAAHDYHQIGALQVSPDSAWLAYCEDIVGRREYILRFKDLRSGETLPEGIPNVEADVAWLNDSAGILYVAKDPKTLLGTRVLRHRVGAQGRGDDLIFEQTDPSFYTSVVRSKSGRFVFIGMESTISSEWRYAQAGDPDLIFRTVLPAERDHEYQIEHWRDEFIIRTNWKAVNFRLMRAAIDEAADRNRWRDLLPHREEALIQDFEVLAHHVAVSERSSGLRKIRIKALDASRDAAGGEFLIDGDAPAYTMSLGVNPDIDSNVLRYSYTSLQTPPSVMEYDLARRERRLLKTEEVLGGFDQKDYVSEFVYAPSRDGKSIPVSIVYHKDTPLDGTAPLLQYGYGAYGHSLDPGFSSSRLSLLDRGLVFALAHVRGGQELGRGWYDDGRMLNKKNSFNDFIDVTRHLVGHRYAAKDRVFAMGGSAGGLLMGAIANLAPGEYRGIVAQVPFVDVVTTMLDESLPLTTNEYDEWGDPKNPAMYSYMLSYSPYDNVSRQAYPAMLITTGLWDSQVQYFEPAKWAARLADMNQGAGPLLFHVDMQTGHGGKSGRFERFREIAREYAFILTVAGIGGRPTGGRPTGGRRPRGKKGVASRGDARDANVRP
jgi:oligopeptidase B